MGEGKRVGSKMSKGCNHRFPRPEMYLQGTARTSEDSKAEGSTEGLMVGYTFDLNFFAPASTPQLLQRRWGLEPFRLKGSYGTHGFDRCFRSGIRLWV